MGILQSISNFIDRLSQKIGLGMAWLTLVVVIIGAVNAVLRYIGKTFQVEISSNALIELQWYLFATIFLLGAAYTLQQNAHVRVDVLYDRLSARKRQWVNLVGHLVFLIPFCVFMLWVCWPKVMTSWRELEQSPDPNGLPRYPIISMLPVAFVLLMLQGISEVIKNVLGLMSHHDESIAGEEPIQ
ncbi:MAG: TRAP transporter small permease subunit [Verrucomicrobiota bacterium]